MEGTAGSAGRWECPGLLLTGAVLTTTARNGQASLPLAEDFADFPVGLLLTEE